MKELQQAITDIGQRLVQCSEPCDGVVHDAPSGILPRCLILERPERTERGCLVAGINPGRSRQRERDFYKEKGPSYEVVTTYWHQNVNRFAYYKRLRQFVDAVGLTGPIIWSDLAKCENSPDVERLIPLQTLRICAGRFLQNELQKTPKDWPVIGVGREAYNALAYLEPSRTVIGIPHPTGSWGQFSSLFVNDSLRDNVAEGIANALSTDTLPLAVWVSAGGVR